MLMTNSKGKCMTTLHILPEKDIDNSGSEATFAILPLVANFLALACYEMANKTFSYFVADFC